MADVYVLLMTVKTTSLEWLSQSVRPHVLMEKLLGFILTLFLHDYFFFFSSAYDI